MKKAIENTDQIIVNQIANTIKESHTTYKEPRKWKPCRLRWKDTKEWVVLPNGKTIWKCKQHAMSAITNFVQNECWRLHYGQNFGYQGSNTKVLTQMVKDLMECVEIYDTLIVD